MKQARNVIFGLAAILLSGCINQPSTKVLLTPIGAVGIHSFAPPERSPDEMKAAREISERLAKMSRENGGQIQRQIQR